MCKKNPSWTEASLNSVISVTILFLQCKPVSPNLSLLFKCLSVVYLTAIFQQLELYSVEWKDKKWMLNRRKLEGSGRGLILRHCSGIRLEELKKQRNTSVRITGLRAEIWTRDLSNRNRSVNLSSTTLGFRFWDWSLYALIICLIRNTRLAHLFLIDFIILLSLYSACSNLLGTINLLVVQSSPLPVTLSVLRPSIHSTLLYPHIDYKKYMCTEKGKQSKRNGPMFTVLWWRPSHAFDCEHEHLLYYVHMRFSWSHYAISVCYHYRSSECVTLNIRNSG
jgi:hypothetical protein